MARMDFCTPRRFENFLGEMGGTLCSNWSRTTLSSGRLDKCFDQWFSSDFSMAISGFSIVQGYVRAYPHKIWQNIWYSTSILGSWRSPIEFWWLKNVASAWLEVGKPPELRYAMWNFCNNHDNWRLQSMTGRPSELHLFRFRGYPPVSSNMAGNGSHGPLKYRWISDR